MIGVFSGAAKCSWYSLMNVGLCRISVKVSGAELTRKIQISLRKVGAGPSSLSKNLDSNFSAAGRDGSVESISGKLPGWATPKKRLGPSIASE